MSSPAEVVEHELGVDVVSESDLYRPIVRIDEPCNPSTRLSERVKLKGWYVAPPDAVFTDLTRRPGVEVLIEPCEPAHPLRKFSEAVGYRLPRTREQGFAFVEYLQLEERPPALPVNTNEVRGQLVSLNGSINIASLIPPDGTPAVHYRVTLILELENWISVSNSVQIAIPPRSEWGNAYGGFLFPRGEEVAADFLVVKGWAVRQGDPLQSVTLAVNDEPLPDVSQGVWSPEIYLSLPDPEESASAVFTTTISRAALAKRGINLSLPVHIQAKCAFQSGEQLSCSIPRFLWRAAVDGVPVGQSRELCGLLERVMPGESGRVRLEGWARSISGATPSLYVEGARRRVLLKEDPAAGTLLRWSTRPDVQQRQVSWSDGLPCGFTAEFDPALLGRMHGIVSVSAELGEHRIQLGEESGDKITALVSQGVTIERALDRVVTSGSVLLSRLGIRKSFDPVSVIASKGQPSAEVLPALQRILFATHNLSTVEGAPKVLWKLISYLQKSASSSLDIVVVSAREGEQRAVLEAVGVQVEVIPELSMVGADFDRYQHGLSQLVARAQAFAPQLVYANVVDCFWGIDCAKRLGIPSLWAIHESVSPEKNLIGIGPVLKIQFLHRFRDATRVLFVSEATRALYDHVALKDRTEVVPNGIDLEEINRFLSKHDRGAVREQVGVKPDEFVVSIIGTTTPRKGQDIFLREMALLRDRVPEVKLRFFVVGCRDGEFLSHLRILAKRYRIDKLTSFVDETPESYRYFLASDVVVVASREESAPLVSLEALAIGVPLVSTTVFGLGEQIRDGKNALAFSLEAEGQLASQVERIQSNSVLRTDLVTEAKRDVAERFELKKSLSLHENAIKRALSTRI